MSQLSYHRWVDRENILRLHNLMKSLPPFYGDFPCGIESRTSSRTRIAYAYDLHVFFDFLHREDPAIAKVTARSIALDQPDRLSVTDFKEYIECLKYHFNGRNQEVMNKERGIMRKMSSLKNFYSYYYKSERVENNPAALVRSPEPREKEIIQLGVDEVAPLLGEVK